MKNYINIAISAKDTENPRLLINLNIFNDSSIYLHFINIAENKKIYADEIKDLTLSRLINILLAEAKESHYLLDEYNQFYINLVNTIFYYINSMFISDSCIYNEISLINLKEY